MLLPSSNTAIVDPDGRFWTKGAQLLCGDFTKGHVDSSYTFLPGGSVVISDKADLKIVGARFRVLGPGSKCVLEGRTSEITGFEEAIRASSLKHIFGYVWVSEIKSVLRVSPQGFLVFVWESFASHSTHSLYYLSEWDVYNKFENSESSYYGKSPSPQPVAISPDRTLALCSDGKVLTLPELKLIRTTTAVPTYATWIDDSTHLITETKAQRFLVWDEHFNVIATTGPHGPDIVAAAFHTEAPLYASATSTGRVRVWNRGDEKLVSLKRFCISITALSFSHAVDCLDVQFDDGTSVIWSFREDNERK